jgi:hypothetical protein
MNSASHLESSRFACIIASMSAWRTHSTGSPFTTLRTRTSLHCGRVMVMLGYLQAFITFGEYILKYLRIYRIYNTHLI